jgi:tRNA A-37 threonylcarbamoyl transferase component Bud32/predicted nucleotidyltransferase
MFSLSPEELQSLKNLMERIAGRRRIVAACIYGSRVAGYARPDSDVDVMIVLENYPYAVKYVYLKDQGLQVSALVVDQGSLEGDARHAHLGEFVVGRLLHVYEPVINAEFFERIERLYKKRVILEEMQNMVGQTSLLCTEISFPLEYVLFSKIKRRASLYPNAAYSYCRTYTASEQNLKFALDGYRRALAEIVAEDKELFEQDGSFLRISEKRVQVEKNRASLKLTKKLQEFSSYFVHTYAGRKTLHLAVREAESKIKRQVTQRVEFPDFMSCPACVYWKLPEGLLVSDSRRQDWIGLLASQAGLDDYAITKKRLGNPNSRTMLYVLRNRDNERRYAVKKLARTKSVKWAALSMWTAPVKKFKIDPLYRLGSAYRAARQIRKLGLLTPPIEAVVLDRRLLITQFIEGRSLADVIRGLLSGRDEETGWLRIAGWQMSQVHQTGASFGNIKPKNIIVHDGLYFTDLEQFVFDAGDPAWDVAQFVCWGLKSSRNADMAAAITKEFLEGYADTRLAAKMDSKQYIATFYPVLTPAVARAIKNEIRNFG